MKTISNTIWLWPCPHTTELSREYYVNSEKDYHRGIDINSSGIYGTPVIASDDGVIDRVFVGCNNISARSTLESCIDKGCGSEYRIDVRYKVGEDDNGEDVYKTVKLCNYSMGNGVFIKHSDNSYSQYVHFSEIAQWILDSDWENTVVKVNRGDIIGYVGSTGDSTGPHLHYSLADKDSRDGIEDSRVPNNKADVNYDTNVHLITNPYKSNGGTLGTSVKNFMINIGGSAKVRSDEPTAPEGYEFDGWLCKVDGVVKGTYGAGETIRGLGTSTQGTVFSVFGKITAGS